MLIIPQLLTNKYAARYLDSYIIIFFNCTFGAFPWNLLNRQGKHKGIKIDSEYQEKNHSSEQAVPAYSKTKFKPAGH